MRAGEAYVDVGTLHGYREAIRAAADAARRTTGALSADAAPRQRGGAHAGSRTADDDHRPARRPGRRSSGACASSGPGSTTSTSAACRPRRTTSWATTRPCKWRGFAHAMPARPDAASTVLDIGCNGGFYALEMKRRGAERVVVGIDSDDRLPRPGPLRRRGDGLEIEFRQLSVYDVAALGERFDLVLFMGVLYHLRHPLLALDLIHEHVASDLLVFQSMQRGSAEVDAGRGGLPVLGDRSSSTSPATPSCTSSSSATPATATNWWIPNRACVGGHAAQRRLRHRAATRRRRSTSAGAGR